MGWYSWWTGKIGSDADKHTKHQPHKRNRPKVALIIGVTGIVGNCLAEKLTHSDAPGGPWKVYGAARKPLPKWLADCHIDYIQCDVLDEADTRDKISLLKDVTHLFWVVWVNQNTEEKNCRVNGKMFENVIEALLPNAPRLQHICLQTGGKHNVGPFELIGKIKPHEPPFHEDMPRLPCPNFYYTLEDVLFETAKKKEGLTWSVHRPKAIFGFSPSSLMNILGGIAVYAAICKYEELPFDYPGNKVTWEQLGDASDAELIAEQEIWASIDTSGKNQILNISNGDVFTYKRVWNLIAAKFGVEVPHYDGQPFSLEERMRNKGHVWDAIVKQHGLLHTKLEDVGNWWFVDVLLNAPVTTVLSMNKSKELGFMGFRNSETSVFHWIDEMRNRKLIPE